MVGNLNEAEKTYSQGEKYIDKYYNNPRFSATFLHTRAAIEFLKGNLMESEQLFEKSKQQHIPNNHFITSVNVYLAKIYVKTDRKEKAKQLLDFNMTQKLLPKIEWETKKVLEELLE